MNPVGSPDMEHGRCRDRRQRGCLLEEGRRSRWQVGPQDDAQLSIHPTPTGVRPPDQTHQTPHLSSPHNTRVPRVPFSDTIAFALLSNSAMQKKKKKKKRRKEDKLYSVFVLRLHGTCAHSYTTIHVTSCSHSYEYVPLTHALKTEINIVSLISLKPY